MRNQRKHWADSVDEDSTSLLGFRNWRARHEGQCSIMRLLMETAVPFMKHAPAVLISRIGAEGKGGRITNVYCTIEKRDGITKILPELPNMLNFEKR